MDDENVLWIGLRFVANIPVLLKYKKKVLA
jgi:hypothetical protein